MPEQSKRIDIINTIIKIIQFELDIEIIMEDFDENAPLASHYGVDSIGFIELRFQCEDVFGVTISDEDFRPSNFRTCATVADFILERQKAEICL